MKILIGSKAMSQYPCWSDRKVNDIDYFSDKDIDGAETFFHQKLINWFGDVERTASMDELFTIKVSHIFWDIRWNKHAYDILKMNQENVGVIPELYDILYSIWEERYGRKKANLNVMADDFFKSTIHRVYDHDSIHASVAYYDEPLFNKILADGQQVKVDRSKFDSLTTEEKYKLVREEVYATALERQVIPSDYTIGQKAAYQWALKKTITSFSKGWFPLFIVLNLDKLWSPDIDYVKRHKNNSNKLIKLGS